MDKKIPIKARLLLESINSEILIPLSKISNSDQLDALKRLYRIYAEIEKDKLIYHPTEDEKKLAHKVSHMQGEVEGIKIIISLVENAQRELQRREKKNE